MAKAKRFKNDESLASPEAVAGYLNKAFASSDVIRITEAIVTAARTEGISRVAIRAGLWRETLHRLAGRPHPDLAIVIKVLAALNLSLVVTPKARSTLATERAPSVRGVLKPKKKDVQPSRRVNAH